MLESGKQSLTGSFRHHQSAGLSHQWEPTDGRPISGTGKGMGLVTIIAIDRVPFEISPSKSESSRRLVTKSKSKQLRPFQGAPEFDFATSSRILDRDEERQLAKQIFRYRRAFKD